MKIENFKIIKRFGPSVLKVKIPKLIIKNLNEHIDEIAENKSKSNKLNYGEKLVGDVTQEFKLEKKIMKKTGWEKFIKSSVKKWLEIETSRKIKKFNIVNSWVVRQFKNEYNPTHWHGGHIAGAGFLKVPKNLVEHIQKKKKQRI